MTRRQLTLFVPPDTSAAVEAVRQVTDPVQHGIIAAHVTLAREDEIAGWTPHDLAARLHGSAGPLSLVFGPPERFEGHGLWRPVIAGADGYHALRRHLLGSPREATPHLTLAHPRNPRAAGNTDTLVAGRQVPLRVTFRRADWIEQTDGGPWRVVTSAPLG